MKKIQIIRVIYDLLSFAIVCAIAFGMFIQSGQFIFEKEFMLPINDTILLDRFGSEQLYNVSGRKDFFSYLDAKGNEISADDYDKYLNQFNSKYKYSDRSSHLDSLKVNTSPHIVIKKAKLKMGFLYKGEKPFIYYIGMFYFIILLLMAIRTFLLIRRIMNLTITRSIYSRKGVGTFKKLFMLSIVYFLIKIAFIPLFIFCDKGIWLRFVNKSHDIYELTSLPFSINEIFINLSIIVITFSIYHAFKYGYEVKTENDLTI